MNQDNFDEEPKDANWYYNRGIDYYNKGEYDKANEDFAKAAEGYYQIGNDYFKIGDIDKAIADYTKVIDLKPNYAEAYHARGNAYLKKGEYDKAIADFNKAIEINSDFAEAFTDRGTAYGFINDLDKAIADFEKAIKLKPSHALAYNNLGLAFTYKKNYEKAIENLKKAIKKNPAFAAAFNNLGVAYYNIGNYDEAIFNYTQALELNQIFALPYRNRGIVYYIKGNWYNAFNDFTKAKAIDPKEGENLTDSINFCLNEIDKIKESAEISGLVTKILAELKCEEKTLTHYTSLTVGKKLLCKNSPLRFSHVSNFNDPNEGKAIVDMFGLKEENLEKHPLFLCSFVADADDLNMWRFYGKENGEDASGCSITYNVKDLKDTIGILIPNNDEKGIDVSETYIGNLIRGPYRVAYCDKIDKNNNVTIYLDGEKNEILTKLFKNLREAVDNFREEKKNIEDKEKTNKTISDLLTPIRYLIKSGHYRYEKESRIIVSYLKLDDKRIKFDVDSGCFPRTFIDFPLLKIPPKHITLGPKSSHFDKFATLFKIKQAQYGNPDFEVKKSNVHFQ